MGELIKLRQLLDTVEDETWIRIVWKGGATFSFWNADYVGGDTRITNGLKSLLDCPVDNLWLETGRNPENDPQNSGDVTFIVVAIGY